MIFATTSHIGLIRKENQDALGHLKTNDGKLFVVCDGVSGLPNGALASKTAGTCNLMYNSIFFAIILSPMGTYAVRLPFS